MYNDQGELKADTNFRLIDKSIFPVLVGSNTSFQYLIITRLNFPAIMMDSGLGGLILFEVNLQKDSTQTHNYKVSSIRLVSKENPKQWHIEMLEDLEFLSQESFLLRGESADPESYHFHIPINFQWVVSNQHKIEKYFEEGVFVYKGYINEAFLIGVPNLGTPYKSGSK
jgi:hypothetical protein